MTVSIMDGHTGKYHVTSDDWAAFNAATYGNQGAVLGSGSFNLTMETSTKGTLSAGLGIVQGRSTTTFDPQSPMNEKLKETLLRMMEGDQ